MVTRLRKGKLVQNVPLSYERVNGALEKPRMLGLLRSSCGGFRPPVSARTKFM